MQLTLAQVQSATGVQTATSLNQRVTGWSNDSRTLAPGDLYFAIRGERFDGHAFVEDAFRRGAIAAVVDEPVNAHDQTILHVPDTLRALQSLAHCARRQWGRALVAVTGSAGKTTTKEVIAALLGTRFQIGKTIGNLNNHIGLPLTLLRIPDNAEAAVVEMGMNHAGEIRQLAAIAAPDIGVITNVGYAHIEAFDSIDGIAAAKRELIESLPPYGTAVLNADDERVRRFREVHRGRVITYGFSPDADVRVTNAQIGSESVAFTVEGVRFESNLAGRHSISNILAGLAVARAFELDFHSLVDAVRALAPGKMRGERSQWRGITILDDSYNSNPEAVRNMIDVLREEPAQRRIAVLGEMLELGHMAESLHRDVGAYVARAGVDVLVGVRGVSRLMVEQAKQAGLANHAALFFDDPDAAGAFLRGFVRPGDAILFKGSRGTQVERALATMEA
jgi:UDP-N-acetylmuramoyl-tripeptide--D-alanyl-D-alanine ligase